MIPGPCAEVPDGTQHFQLSQAKEGREKDWVPQRPKRRDASDSNQGRMGGHGKSRKLGSKSKKELPEGSDKWAVEEDVGGIFM